jgi:mRNA interferase RelE/StbE
VSYTVTIGSRAEREFLRLKPKTRDRVAGAIAALSEDPRPHGARKLKSAAADSWRVRVGSYRVLYTVDDGRSEVVVYRISPREKAYR